MHFDACIDALAAISYGQCGNDYVIGSDIDYALVLVAINNYFPGVFPLESKRFINEYIFVIKPVMYIDGIIGLCFINGVLYAKEITVASWVHMQNIIW